jgi:hypothetical protein
VPYSSVVTRQKVSGNPLELSQSLVHTLTALLADPNVNVVGQRVRLVVLLVAVEDDVTVAGVKRSIFRRFPRHDAKLFDPPHFQSNRFANAVPLGFAGGRRGLDLVIELFEEESASFVS